jgi:DNA-binding LacI/PurR family transcriptional regulator
MRERLAGFKKALNDHRIFLPDEWVLMSPLSAEAGKQATLSLLSRPDRPRALFVNNNFLSLGALQAVKELGLRCPEDIALVGFDDHPWASVSAPPLTVIRQPVLQIGETAAHILLAMIDDIEMPHTRNLLECELVIRESCGYSQRTGRYPQLA